MKTKIKRHYNWELLQREYDSGLSIKEISVKYKMSHMTVKKAAKLGIFKIRTPAEVRKLSIKKHGLGFGTSEQLRIERYRQMMVEEDLANDLRRSGFQILSPTVVCDRIGIKNGKLYFIEFKPTGQVLREYQQIVCDTTLDKYKIVYYDKQKYRSRFLNEAIERSNRKMCT